jgi:type I restriction-modification system DNA methylase subunit
MYVAPERMRNDVTLLRQTLETVGYLPDCFQDSAANVGDSKVHWCVAYARQPKTSRHACVAFFDERDESHVEGLLFQSGAPVGLIAKGNQIRILRCEENGLREMDRLPRTDFSNVSQHVRTLLDPRSIYRAKTFGRFDGAYQLDFVDAGLLPRIERAQGADLEKLLERIVAELRTPNESFNPEEGHQILTLAFWILAARMLRDHGVPAFVNLEADGRSVLSAVARHYGGAIPALAGGTKWRKRIDQATILAWKHGGNLSSIGPEAVGYVYESSLIAKRTRKDLGTHSTPPFLVDYVLGRLRKEIQAIPVNNRFVVEPACGHGAFLVAALEILAEDIPENENRHVYLRSRLRGLEIDHAAKEMARLSLTLADIPNPDGWDLREGDMFAPGALAALGQGGTILLANPPFEDFDADTRERLGESDSGPIAANKTAEMLRRILPTLDKNAVLGVIVPRSFLHAADARDVRRMLLNSFQILEICVFPDRVFRFSDLETALILARGTPEGTNPRGPVLFRRVREHSLAAFRNDARVTEEDLVPGRFFRDNADANLSVPELRRLWTARAWPTLADIATIQQGLSYHGWVRKQGYDTVRNAPFPDSMLGIAPPGQSGDPRITDELPHVYMDAQSEHIMAKRGGLPTNEPQVVLNTHPHGRGPYRLMAFIDPRGAAIPSTRIVVRPRDSAMTVEVLWALCNSLVANAYAYAHFGKRDITTTPFGKLPVPAFSKAAIAELTTMVREFFAEARNAHPHEKRQQELLARIDAFVLGSYGLFAGAEQRLLALFEGHTRIGLSFACAPANRATRLPQYLEHEGLTPEISQVDLRSDVDSLPDIDAEIEDGRHELAALRRVMKSGDARIAERMKFVRRFVEKLEERAADLGIESDPRPS